MTRYEFVEIIRASQKGERAAFDILYDEYFGKLFTAAFKLVQDADAAYDIATDVVLKLLEFNKEVLSIRNHVAYMITMVKNQAKDYIAKRSREVSVAEIWKSKEVELPDMLWLEDIFRILTEEEKDVFLLHYIWDLPLGQVASQLNLTYGTVKARNTKVARKLRVVYGERRK